MRAHPIVLVTGSTRGIGKKMALRFAAAGAIIGLNHVSDQESAEQTLREVQQIESASRLYRADVSRPEEAKNVIQSLVRDFGRIDILVNNAGPM
ncbi:MAG: SDR family NAD(P)-dependent oxidoreductase, partial [bacterium]|nr:SDR family NAD(P)-dependent oxidoreductase [bacterium]